MRRRLDRQPENISRICTVTVEPEHARFSSWYEFFPRSSVDGTDQPNTLADAIDRLDYVADLGFDIVYLPPIHPIGRRSARGRTTRSSPGGRSRQPWAIGAEEGGPHRGRPRSSARSPTCRSSSRRARSAGMHLALDLAFQCAPDHPWVEEHPDWFVHRADGTIQYARTPRRSTRTSTR
jgi:starch synthase (maltosyl-transferring)